MPDNFLVSVVMITYKQEAFIEQAIRGVLMQVLDKEIELIIADDNSPDNTQRIIQEISSECHQAIRIRSTRHTENKGVMGNFMWALKQARGKYIALCEGDDYWTDPYKLQKQIDFLENNPEYVLCFHRINVLQNEVLGPDPLEERYNRIVKFPIGRMDLIEQSNFIHTHSVVFRNIIRDFPAEFQYSPAGDLPLYITLAEHGFIHRVDDFMGVYRMGSGVYSTLDSFNLMKQKLKLEIAILSMLRNNEEKEIVIKKIFRTLDGIKNPLAPTKIFDSLKDVVSAKLMFQILIHKLKSTFRSKFKN